MWEMEIQRAKYSGPEQQQSEVIAYTAWMGSLQEAEFLEGFLEEVAPELRLVNGSERARKGVSAEGRPCSRSWKQGEPVSLQTVVCMCSS